MQSSLGKLCTQPPTILIVDDDPTFRELMTEVLTFEGYRTREARDAREALPILMDSSLPLSLLLLDLWRRDDGNWHLAQRLKDACLALPIVVLSTAFEAGELAEEVKADGWLAKPFDLDDLLDIIQRICPANEAAVA